MKFFKNTNASSNVLNEFVYSYNTANQITQITEPSKTRTFVYDNADRLTTSTSTLPNQNESYTFDDVGNRTSSHLSSVYGYQQGSFNRLASTQQASYSFDNNGNLTSKSDSNSKWYYSYDRENRLMNATKFGGMMPRANESVNYQYDAFGRRVVRQDKKTGRTEFTHDGMDVIQDRFEKNDGTLSTTNYINGIGIDDKLKITTGTTSKYFLTDHLGSTVGMADTNGNVTESASYDSFGRIQSSNLMTRYQYTGRETDETTGLMYYRARQYDPQIGRFTSEDPIGLEGGVNSYSYVKNEPMSFRDSLGLQQSPLFGADPLKTIYKPKPNTNSVTVYGEDAVHINMGKVSFLPRKNVSYDANGQLRIFNTLNHFAISGRCAQAYRQAGLSTPAQMYGKGIVIGEGGRFIDPHSELGITYGRQKRSIFDGVLRSDSVQAFTIQNKPGDPTAVPDGRPRIFVHHTALKPQSSQDWTLSEVLAHELIHVSSPGYAPNWFVQNFYPWGHDLYNFSEHDRILNECGCIF